MEDVIEKKEDDIGADILAAMEEVEEPSRDDSGKFKSEEPASVAEPVADIPPPPQGWNDEVKGEWANIPEKVRQQIIKREEDSHRAITNQDNDRLLGKDIKEIVTPYMPLIQAAGSTPKATINNLLNTAYKLQTGDEATKLAIVKQIAKDYNVKLVADEESEYVDPTIASLRQEIDQLKQIANPQAIEMRLREQLEGGKVQSDIAAFASDPANIHFETVRPIMSALIGAGQAKDLKEAYDMACMANPQIRSTLESAKNAELAAKRKQEVNAKKRAASSIAGSPATVSSNSKANPKTTSVEDDLRAAFDELESRI